LRGAVSANVLRPITPSENRSPSGKPQQIARLVHYICIDVAWLADCYLWRGPQHGSRGVAASRHGASVVRAQGCQGLVGRRSTAAPALRAPPGRGYPGREGCRMLGRVGALVVVAAAVGCGSDRCSGDPFQNRRCNGNVVEMCFFNEVPPGHWTPEKHCGSLVCVEDALLIRGADCVLDPEPRPACGTDFAADVCDSTDRLRCEGGYVIAAQGCASADLCEPRAASCLARPGEDPVCLPDGFGLLCDGTLAIVCESGYRAGEVDCGGPGCRDGRCLPGGAPDTRCQANLAAHPGATLHATCDGNVAIECDGEYLVGEQDCGVRYCCDPATMLSDGGTLSDFCC
jgi:hypothetical protein